MTSRGSGPADAYIRYYEALSLATLSALDNVVTPDVRFKDPFNDVRGIEHYRRLLTKMFDAVPDVRFCVSQQAVDGETCFIRWRCEGTIKAMGAAPWLVEGMSELRFAPDGRVREHIDHWDAASQFYERLPVIGWLLRLIRRRFASHQ
jgi:steroid delta-isomerase